jgi:hypothetical protein
MVDKYRFPDRITPKPENTGHYRNPDHLFMYEGHSMNKQALLIALLFGLTTVVFAQPDGIVSSGADTAAILVLDRMSDMIGSLTSCSYTLRTSHDVQDPDHGTITRLDEHKVYMTGPDRLHVNSTGEKGHRGYWYNGSQVSYYSFTENNYGFMEAPDNIMATIEEVHTKYGVDFPAADFFYPTFTDDLIEQSSRIDYLGTVQIKDQECFRIVARGKDQSVQLWIANDATFLPMKFIITDHTQGNAQYHGTFADWEINPDLPMQLYEFNPPPGASRLRIIPRTSN